MVGISKSARSGERKPTEVLRSTRLLSPVTKSVIVALYLDEKHPLRENDFDLRKQLREIDDG